MEAAKNAAVAPTTETPKVGRVKKPVLKCTKCGREFSKVFTLWARKKYGEDIYKTYVCLDCRPKAVKAEPKKAVAPVAKQKTAKPKMPKVAAPAQ